MSSQDTKPKLEFPNDPQLKALRTLLDTLHSQEDREEIEDAIATRINQLKRPKFMF